MNFTNFSAAVRFGLSLKIAMLMPALRLRASSGESGIVYPTTFVS